MNYSSDSDYIFTPLRPVRRCPDPKPIPMPAEEDRAAMDGSRSPQQFCLRWNNYQNNLTSCFDMLLQSQAFTDVTLACEGKSLKVHKVVLIACSPYFQELLMENPCQHPIIIIKDVKYSDLKAAVDFMYRGEINVSQDQISALLKVADMLRIRGLADVGGDMAGTALGRGIKRSASNTLDHSPVQQRRVSDDEAGPTPPCATPPPPAETPERHLARTPERHHTRTPERQHAPTPHHHDDVDIRPGIAEMIREEERARMMENRQPWLVQPSTSAGLTGQLADTYQYRMQHLWQQCWNTNQNMVQNMRLRERGPLKSWRAETMAEAIFSVLKEGLSLSQAARKYDIPYPTFVLYANRVHNMLGPSADGGADLRPKGRGRPQRILLGVWPDDHIRGVIRAVVFRENHAQHPQHHLREIDLPIYPAITEGPTSQTNQVGGNGCGGREGRLSPNAAAAAAVAAVAHGLRQQMCNMVVAAQRPGEQGGQVALPPLPLHSPRLPSPISTGLESPLTSPPPPGLAIAASTPFRPFASPPHFEGTGEMRPPRTPITNRNGQGASPVEAENPPLGERSRLDI